MNEVSTIFQPHPGPQTRFMEFDGRYALLGGAAGGGKTDCLIYDPFRQIAIETARVNRREIRESTGRAILFRRTMPELREVMDRCQRTFRRIDPGVRWVSDEKTWTFSCGYKYMLAQMEESGDWVKYLGFEFTWIGFDELTTFTEEQFEMLDTRLRTADPVLRNMLYVRAGTNPIGLGLQWVRKRFVEPAPPNTPVIRRIKTPVVGPDGITRHQYVEQKQIFIPARLHDNPSLDQAQYAAGLVTKSSARRKALLEGDWYAIEGAWVGDFWEQDVHVCEPFRIPGSWYKFRSCDFGTAKPASVDWWAVDPDGNLTCFKSFYKPGHNSEMLAYAIKEIEMELGFWDPYRGCSMLSGPLDNSCWNKTGGIGPPIAETMAEVGVFWDKSTKDRHFAADQMRTRLARRTPHPTLKGVFVPGIRWFKTCRDAIRTIPSLPCDENDPEVPDTDAEDHAYDSASYACMSRPMRPERLKDGEPDISYFLRDDLQAARLHRERQSRGSKTGYPGGW